MTTPKRRRIRPKLRRIDLMFLVGATVFLSQALHAFDGHPADSVIVYGAIALMGIPVFARLEGQNENRDDK
jgi:hypothetical protein